MRITNLYNFKKQKYFKLEIKIKSFWQFIKIDIDFTYKLIL